jgi:hypothetical protein
MTALERPDSIQRYHYSSHEARNFERDFDFLSSGKIHSIEITDRYMTASESAKEALFKFLTVIADLWAVPPKTIILQHGPARNQQDRTKWIKNMDWVVKQLSKDNRFAEIELKTPFRGTNRVRNFHDRRVVALFEAVSSQCMPTRKASRRRRPPSDSLRKSLVTAELTGGIDILLDKREETTVFVIDQRIQ